MQLLEREQCLTDLSGWFEATRHRGGGVVLVSGEAGIGKTVLLRRFTAQLPRSTRVLWGACDPLSTPRPLAPLHDIAQQVKGGLLEALSETGKREASFNAMLDLLDRQDAAVVVLEDLHWADDATLDMLKFLGRRIHRTRAMLLVTYRDDEVRSRHPLRFAIADLPRTSVHRMLLPALSPDAVAHLAAQAGQSAHGLHATTGGNPLFVTEVLAAGSDQVPATVSDAVLARAARLSAAAREVAELVAIVPPRAESWLLEQLVPIDDAAIESCLSIGMVHDDAGSLAFRHELARRAFEDSLSQRCRQNLHARVLTVLTQRPDVPAARLVHHAEGAGDVQSIVQFAPLAGAHAAAVGAHREAASHYDTALKYAQGMALPARADLLERLSYECYLTDQIEQAITSRKAALEIWQSSGAVIREGDALRWLSRLHWFHGKRAEADQYAAAAIATLEPLPPGPELTMAYSNQAQLDMLSNRNESAIHWARRSIALAESSGNQEILSHALNNLGTARVNQDDPQGWIDLERSLQVALAGGFEEHVARAYTNLSYSAVMRREYSAAARFLRDGLAYCEARDLDSWRLYMLAWSARGRLEQDDWQGAADEVEIVLRHPRTASITRLSALTVLGQIRARRGDPDADSPLTEARELAALTHESCRISAAAIAQADAAWAADALDGMTGELQAAYELARQTDDRLALAELAVWLWRANALTDPPQGIPEAFACELSGDWRRAAELWKGLGCLYNQACVLAIYGAQSEQLEALAIFDRLGALPASQVLRRKMRLQGVRGIPRGARASTRNDPRGLTRREAQILELLCEGLSNSAIAKRLFVATKTVDHHVSAILTKLDVPSRAAAIALTRNRTTA